MRYSGQPAGALVASAATITVVARESADSVEHCSSEVATATIAS